MKIKNLFSTPKKTAITVVCIILILAVCVAAAVLIAGAIARRSSIGEDFAKQFAYADAGVDVSKVTASRAEFEFEDGQYVYEVTFFADNVEYEYLLRASDGAVVKKESEPVDGRVPAVTNPSVSATTPSQTAPSGGNSSSGSSAFSAGSVQLTLDAAKQAALNDAKLAAADVTFIEEHADYDDGTPVYDLSFVNGTNRYEYEIDANTGAVRSKEVQPINSQDATVSGTDIGVDQAKTIAAQHAGFGVNDVVFSKTKLERDDGLYVYEIEFYKDGAEYDCTINAANGSVLEYEVN